MKSVTYILGNDRLVHVGACRIGFLLASVAVLAALAPVPGIAHEEILVQIKKLDARMATEGASAELLFKRAELHLVHEDWKPALDDFTRALNLNPKLRGADLGIALPLAGG